MNSIPLLILAAASVGFLHAILPDHWVPLAVVARTQRWSIWHTARITFLASAGHVLTSIVLGGIIALVGLQFRGTFETQQNHIVGGTLVITGIVFVILGLRGQGHTHRHDHSCAHLDSHPNDDSEPHHHADADHPHMHTHTDSTMHAERESAVSSQPIARRLAAIAIPFGAAASPDLTILPVFLAASAISLAAVTGVLVTFSVATIATFLVLTLSATLIGYRAKGEWLERNGNTITGFVLVIIGVAVFFSFV